MKKENSFEATLRAVGGKEGIAECLRHNNDAPLALVILAARGVITELENKLKEVLR